MPTRLHSKRKSSDPSILKNLAINESLTGGPRLYSSFADYFTQTNGIVPPPPITVPWSRTWRLAAPEFDNDEEVPPSAASSSSPATANIHCSSFGEFAYRILGIRSLHSILHVPWTEKTPMLNTVQSSESKMAYRFVNPAPFMPPRAQRVIVPGRPTMMRVVTGRVHEMNNDVAIARLHPLPLEPMNFEDIRNILEDYLQVHLGIPVISIQPCPYGQAYVWFSRLFHRDQLIQAGPAQFGNGHISFIPHNRAWNNRTAVFTHEVWLLLIGLNLDL